MCLDIKSRKIHTADKNITVYKLLSVGVKGSLRAPHRDTRYFLGKTKEVNANFSKQLNSGSINKGLHAFLKSYTARRYWVRHDLRVFAATIPRGSKYILGKGGQIVSTQLRIEKEWKPTKK